MLEGTALILSVLAILSLIGLSIYFYMDVDKHKVENVKDLNAVKTDITGEKNDRLGNLAYVIDQVNVINKDIKTTYDTANAKLTTNVTNLGTRIDGVESGFGSLLSIRSGSSNIPLSSLASVSQPNIDLIKNISVLGGMNIKDVQTSKQFKVCGGTGTSERCIQFPNSDGDTYLTNLFSGKSVVFDAPSKFNGLTKFSDRVNIANSLGFLETTDINQVNPTGQIRAGGFNRGTGGLEKGLIVTGTTHFENDIQVRGDIYMGDPFIKGGPPVSLKTRIDTLETKVNALGSAGGGGGNPPSGGGGNPPSGGGGNPPSGGGGNPPSGGGGNPPSGGGGNPPSGGGGNPPSGGGGNPPSGGGENPPSGGGENPPSGGGENPPSGGGENPPSGGGENPPSGGGENPPSGNDGGLQGCPYPNDANYYCADGSSSGCQTFKVVNGQRQVYEDYMSTVGDITKRSTLADCSILNTMCPLASSPIPA